MNRRSILKLLGLAPVAAPVLAAIQAIPTRTLRVVEIITPHAQIGPRAYGMTTTIDDQTARLTVFVDDTIRGGQAQLSRSIEKLSMMAQEDIRHCG
ncbi:hypothetical protein [Methylobacterium aquaticum]|jgi:hypothetical protein|uniref:Uncharacterized protein n=1 Tax=Methylobacterium aquaticum TaxID=270351 RepID=A0A0J6V5Z1_9HYPH|nr:hypothetical protein [Methylobacterium aquaticum]KMO34331.1 hypothetical protein VP06_14800 [Methylobacterium aquaticum]